ncbi:MAG: stalk domain-containing protein, partial [Ruminiclostridium sp.]
MIKKVNMKKVIFCIIIFCSILLIQNTVLAAQTLSFNYDGKTVKYSGTTYRINIDNKEVKTDFPGIVFNKVTMLPVRALFEQMGGKVIWNSKTLIMDVTYNGMALQFKSNDANAKLNGKTIKLSAPVKKINDRLIMPIDFFKQIKELSIVIDDKAKSINISTKKPAKSESNAKTLTFEYDGKTTKYSGATYKINIDNKEVKTDFPG